MKSLRFGIIFRSFTKIEEDINDIVARAVFSVRKAIEVGIEDIVILVPVDCDCGKTAKYIKEALKKNSLNVNVIEPKGDCISCALNVGLKVLDILHVDVALIISNKAVSNLNLKLIDEMEDAFNSGANVVGVEIDKLTQRVCDGRVQNTFAGWLVKELLEIGGFDSYIGVEEITPTVQLIRENGPCIAILDIFGSFELDIRHSIDGQTRHQNVMSDKTQRQLKEVNRAGVDFSFIKNGILPGYPKLI